MKKHRIKNWINFLTIASLTTACGALKHDNNSQASTKNASVITATQLNNLDPQPADWLSPSGKKFEAIGKISKQDAINLIGTNEDSVISVGTLSLTRATREYDSQYTNETFQPTNTNKEEDHSEITVYFGQDGKTPDTTSVLISAEDFQSIQAIDTDVTIHFDVQLVCTQWGLQLPLNSLTNCPKTNDAVECSAYGVCKSQFTCVSHLTISGSGFSFTNNVVYDPISMKTPNPEDANCEKSAQWPTKSAKLTNESKITEFRINPMSGSPLKAAVTFQGEQLN